MIKPVWIATVVAAACLALLVVESPVALALTLLEGLPAVAAMLLTSLSGVWIVRWMERKQQATELSMAGRLVVGAGLGVGILAVAVLAIGSVGKFNRQAAFAVTILLSALGIAATALEWRQAANRAEAPQTRLNLLWLLAIPFLAITCAAACFPPGILWREEGFGYDVLEYHLAVPKIFAELGRITFLSNNVYSNFPMNSEMLSLLMMQMRGDPIEAAFMATFVNVALAMLFVAASWWAGSSFGGYCGLVSGIMAAATPWLAYLSGIAYVEAGMLAAGMASLGLLMYCAASSNWSWRRMTIAGALAGISCGFKYTAVPMIAAPLVMIPLIARGTWSSRLQRGGLFVAGSILAFSPWMIRNVINTGNPVFPLAYSVFGSKPGLWDSQMEAVWKRAHGSSEAEQNAAPAWQRGFERSLADPRLGRSLFALGAIGAIRRRDRWTVGLIGIALWQLIFWFAFTHLYARFAVVMLLPLLMLAARSGEGLPDARFFKPQLNGVKEKRASHELSAQHSALSNINLLIVILIAGCIQNLYCLGKLFYDETRPGGQRLEAYGHTNWFVSGEWPGTDHWGGINKLPAGSRVMLVGEARTFYLRTPVDYAVIFNRHPLAEAVRRDPQPAHVLDWLRKNGDTHLLLERAEVLRLSSTYGFYEQLTPEFFAELQAAGLKTVADYTVGQNAQIFATLYEVPRQ